MAVMTEERAIEMLKERLRGQRSGEVEVTDVRTEFLLDSYAEEYLAVTLVLTDPPPRRETWPLESVRDLRRRARDIAGTLPIATRVGVDVRARPDYDESIV